MEYFLDLFCSFWFITVQVKQLKKNIFFILVN